MRKTGIITAALGAALFGLLLYLRGTEWFAGETARGMSDFAELVESAFWASLVLGIFGLFLLLLSFRPGSQPPENDAPAPLLRTWVCPSCGQVNGEEKKRCQVCGSLRGQIGGPGWRCPFCGTDNPETAVQCQSCAAPKDRPLLTWICQSCGRENPETETRCTGCQLRRFPATATWVCPACGIANEEGARACKLCGARRAEDTWACGYCGRRNKAGRTVCTACGRPKGYRGRAWLCPLCGSTNRSDREICAACGQPKPM